MRPLSAANMVEMERTPYLDEDNFVSREVVQGADTERRLRLLNSPYATVLEEPLRGVYDGVRSRSGHDDAVLSSVDNLGGPGGDGGEELNNSIGGAETVHHEDGRAEDVEEALGPLGFVDAEVVPEGKSPTYDEEYLESHAGVVGPSVPPTQSQAGGGGTTALAMGAAAIGNLLWQVAPAGFRIAIYDPGNKEFERRAAEWATRERALGHIGKRIDATTLQFDRATPDSSGLVKVVSEVSAAAKVAVAATTRPQDVVPLAGTGPDLVRSLAIFSHGSSSRVGIGNGITKANAADVVRRIASALTNDVQVILYGCSSGRGSTEPGGWQQTTMRVGGADSIAAAVRDALVDQGKTGATVWAHTQVGHTTRNPTLRFFSASSGKGTDGRPYAGEFVFGTVERIAALGELEQAVRGLGFTIEDADQEKFRDHAYKLLEKHMYQAYVEAVASVETRRDGTKVWHTNLTLRGANLPEVAPLYPLDVADVIRKHWQKTYWTLQRQPEVAKQLAKALSLRNRGSVAEEVDDRGRWPNPEEGTSGTDEIFTRPTANSLFEQDGQIIEFGRLADNGSVDRDKSAESYASTNDTSPVEGKQDEEAGEEIDVLDEGSGERADNSYFRVANDITGSFEGGKTETLNLYDRGIISYGKHQATLASGTLYDVLKRYCDLSNTDTARKLAGYLDRVKSRDEGLRDDKAFVDLLRAAARESEMSAAQDEMFAKLYWEPAKKAAASVGLASPLGHAILYDTRVQGGLLRVLKQTTKHLGGKVGDSVEGRVITEQQFLRAFVDARTSRTLRIASRQMEDASRLKAEAQALQADAAKLEPAKAESLRSQAARRLRDAERTSANAKALQTSATKTRGPSFRALVDSGDLDLRGSADGKIQLVGKPGVSIRGLQPRATIDEAPIGSRIGPGVEGSGELIEVP